MSLSCYRCKNKISSLFDNCCVNCQVFFCCDCSKIVSMNCSVGTCKCVGQSCSCNCSFGMYGAECNCNEMEHCSCTFNRFMRCGYCTSNYDEIILTDKEFVDYLKKENKFVELYEQAKIDVAESRRQEIIAKTNYTKPAMKVE